MICHHLRDRRWRIGLGVLLVLLIVAGCAAQQRGLPSLASPATETHRHGEFVWFDLLVDDPDEAQKFYGPMFGWTFDPLDDGDYDTIRLGGRPIGGLIQHKPENDSVPDDIWLPSLSVARVEDATKRAQQDGGNVIMPPRDVGDRGRVSILRDPEGAVFAVMHAAEGDPHRTRAVAGDFVWVQLWSRDHEVPVDFYDDVAGWNVGEVLKHDDIEEGFFEREGLEVASVIELPWKKVSPHWLPYVGVDDVGAAVDKATKLGGRVLVRGKHVAIVQDSQGAAIGLAPLAAKDGSDR